MSVVIDINDVSTYPAELIQKFKLIYFKWKFDY